MEVEQTSSKRLAADRSEIPLDILLKIVGKLSNISDYIRFRSVCASWRLAAGFTELKPQLPWLVAPCRKDGNANTLSLFSISGKRRVCFHNLDEARTNWVYGSSHGWLLMIARPTSQPPRVVTLVHPITRAQILLPPLPNEVVMTSGVRKFVVCSNPASYQAGHLMVAVSASKRLAFFCQRDYGWNIVNYGYGHMHDMVFFDENLYVVNGSGRLSVLQKNSSTVLYSGQPDPPHVPWPSSFRLVEAAGDLLLLATHSKLITVFKRQRGRNGEWEWVAIGDIDMTFFWRPNCGSPCICAQGLPGCGGYRIFLAYTCHKMLCNGVAAIVQVTDYVPGVGVIEQPYVQVPAWSQKQLTLAGLTWMVPSLG